MILIFALSINKRNKIIKVTIKINQKFQIVKIAMNLLMIN